MGGSYEQQNQLQKIQEQTLLERYPAERNRTQPSFERGLFCIEDILLVDKEPVILLVFLGSTTLLGGDFTNSIIL